MRKGFLLRETKTMRILLGIRTTRRALFQQNISQMVNQVYFIDFTL